MAEVAGRRLAGVNYTERDRERWVAEDPAHKRADRDDFARDRARIVHSASLRRLSAKTQVVQPGSDDFVRNRLTHSLEVAQIGREFGAALGCSADVVDTACLAHDLGHPPFGHNGESALDAVAAGIGGFEGNAQTLRLLTRLEPKRSHPDGRPAGLNLTRASLDAATKYPWRRGQGPRPTVKFGVYEDDLDVFTWFRAEAPEGRRSVEAEVMDWSDDVAYSVHDVEDAVASGWLDPRRLRDRSDVEAVLAVATEVYEPDLVPDELAEALDRVLATGAIPDTYDGSRQSLAALKDMTSRLIGRFVVSVERATRELHGPGLSPGMPASSSCRAGRAPSARSSRRSPPTTSCMPRSASACTCASASSSPSSSPPTSPTRRGSTRTCVATGSPPPGTPPPCGSSSTRSRPSRTSAPSTCTAAGAVRRRPRLAAYRGG